MNALSTFDKILDHPFEPLAVVDCYSLAIIKCNNCFEDHFSIYIHESTATDIYTTIGYNVPREKIEAISKALLEQGIYIDKETSDEEHFFFNKFTIDGKEYGYLRLSQQKKFSIYGQYRQLFDQNLAGVYKIDVEGKILSCNEAFAKIFGYESEKDLLGINAIELYKNPESRKEYIKQLREKIVLKNFEIEVNRKDGTTATCLENCFLERLPSGREIISGTIIDFTEKKQIEFDLQEREQWLRSLTNLSSEGVVFERNGDIVMCNNQFASMFDYSSGENIIGLKLTDFIPQTELSRIKSSLKIVPGSKTEIRLYPNDKPLFVEVTGSYITYKGELTLALVMTNVTERKKIELALERGVVRFKNLLENLPNGVIILTDGRIKYLNNAAYTLLGAEDEDEVYNEFFEEFISEPFKNQVLQNLSDVRQGLEVEYMELQMVSLQGETFAAGIKMVLTIYENKPSIQITLTNLSDRNRLAQEQVRMRLVEELNTVLKQEIALHKSTQQRLEQQQRETNEQRAKLEAIFNSTVNLMMWTVDLKGHITNFNRNFKIWTTQHFGSDAAIGSDTIKNVEPFLHPDLYQNQLKAFEKAFSGKPQQTEIPILDVHGDTIWLELFLNPVYIDDEFIEISCLASDITERKEYEKSMRQSLKEKEVLLKEIHHRVKNNLQIISSMLNLQSAYVNDEATLNVLRESQERINSMSLIHETIYRNSDFSAIDFTEYIKSIAANLVQSYGNPNTHVELVMEMDKVLIGLDQSIPCGLIVNELVSNAMKYAFVGRKKGKLCIQVKEKKGGKIELVIKDDGIGLPSTLDAKHSGSLGLTLVNALTEQLDGTLNTKSNKGTAHTLTFIRK
ncbi:MAG TPA: PAS domain S-box protein [Flavobacteriales bacterium]